MRAISVTLYATIRRISRLRWLADWCSRVEFSEPQGHHNIPLLETSTVAKHTPTLAPCSLPPGGDEVSFKAYGSFSTVGRLGSGAFCISEVPFGVVDTGCWSPETSPEMASTMNLGKILMFLRQRASISVAAPISFLGF